MKNLLLCFLCIFAVASSQVHASAGVRLYDRQSKKMDARERQIQMSQARKEQAEIAPLEPSETHLSVQEATADQQEQAPLEDKG